jgi:hypothetical protein
LRDALQTRAATFAIWYLLFAICHCREAAGLALPSFDRSASQLVAP